MIRKLIPVLLALLGLGAGVGAGFALRPAGDAPPAEGHGEEAAADAHAPEGHGAEAPAEAGHDAGAEEGAPEYVKLNNQFVVPVLEGGRVVSMVILSLNLEVGTGQSEAIYAREPKLRDAFLQVLFDHANAGGFRGSFTDGSNLVILRRALLEKARTVAGEAVLDVLISDIARQDA
ncbi:MAG: flagellar basal body-associated protein FliL [Rhodobacteraceae bacterium]|nr:flagellar basal body-associated protein FliL [Paracoccaceae bacterium]